MVNSRPLSGSMSFIVALPRSQPIGISHGSRRTFTRPYSFIFSAVQLLARSRFFEPVRRGPITSERYCKFFMISERALTSAISAWSRSAGDLISGLAAGAAAAPAWRGAGAGSTAVEGVTRNASAANAPADSHGRADRRDSDMDRLRV